MLSRSQTIAAYRIHVLFIFGILNEFITIKTFYSLSSAWVKSLHTHHR